MTTLLPGRYPEYGSGTFLCQRNHQGKIFMQFGKEIPYSTEVVIDEFREQHDDDPSRKELIRCSIVVERDTQKHIIIGRKGSALKN